MIHVCPLCVCVCVFPTPCVCFLRPCLSLYASHVPAQSLSRKSVCACVCVRVPLRSRLILYASHVPIQPLSNTCKPISTRVTRTYSRDRVLRHTYQYCVACRQYTTHIHTHTHTHTHTRTPPHPAAYTAVTGRLGARCDVPRAALPAAASRLGCRLTPHVRQSPLCHWYEPPTHPCWIPIPHGPIPHYCIGHRIRTSLRLATHPCQESTRTLATHARAHGMMCLQGTNAQCSERSTEMVMHTK